MRVCVRDAASAGEGEGEGGRERVCAYVCETAHRPLSLSTETAHQPAHRDSVASLVVCVREERGRDR